MQAPIPVIALVGYTNAGKSTLLNSVTEATVVAEDKLFATLDPTTRKVALPSSKQVCGSSLALLALSQVLLHLVATLPLTLLSILCAGISVCSQVVCGMHGRQLFNRYVL